MERKPIGTGMEVIIVGSMNEAFTFTVGDQILFVPAGKNPDAEIIEITVDETEGGVPITTLKISPRQWAQMAEQVYLSLIGKGRWPKKYAQQFLPGGGR